MISTSSWQASGLVALGGGTGALLRFHVGRLVTALVGPAAAFPWGTFLINVSGSLAMGLLAGWLTRANGGEAWRLLLAVGVLGGFTTFSSFSLETALLIERGAIGLAATYAVGSVLAGLAGLFLGLIAMRGGVA
ncbi:fluoride efflux transporter CrcB [Novosphingobium olei]|uniref:Fluoride-specific ion channel FluC n=1 Tax=Novosphingobium olei TaxID=2728851 RepID=A0A7Y0BSB5_9SPHN|nr:fluoride efflux transporter CrcB [Novosphingobium olei]NML95395.1 fluoride efflux transporter CrcB [Novosphingobium olei]BEU99005.1 fluoride efflux transporter CrcB [Novosphingobium olei]